VAVFYASPGCLFHFFVSPGHQVGSFSFRLLLIHPEVEEVIYWMPKILFAAKVAFRRQNRSMPQEKLNLLKLAAV